MKLQSMLPESWQAVLSDEFNKPYLGKLEEFLEGEYEKERIYPPKDDIFTTFNETAYEEVRVLLLGQDPYHGDGQGHGLSFSVRPKVKIPPSLRNIYKELNSAMNCTIPNNGYLMPWCKQGIMLLNAVLTVRAHNAGSHKKQGWEKFTDAVIKKLNEREEPMVFLLWGGFAKKKAKFIDTDRHTIVQCAHPSPFSARNGFFGSDCFNEVNAALKSFGKEPIDWQIPNI
jgi:uracil-DNA glycosylase